MPWQSISANVLVNKDFPEYPFFSGTGFFVYFPPYNKQFFYISAKHCFTEYIQDNTKYTLEIPYIYKTIDKKNKIYNEKKVPFESYIIAKINNEDNDFEDLIIFPIEEKLKKEEIKILQKRALRLQHQEDIDTILKSLSQAQGNIRTLGFPKKSKNIDFDNKESKIQPRGFYGKVAKKNNDEFLYYFNEPSWKEGEFNGFSGSPIIEIYPFQDIKDYVAVPIGVLLSATQKKGIFVSINVVTNIIAHYLNEKKLL